MKRKTLTKADIAQAIYDKMGYHKSFNKNIVDDFFQIIKNYLVKGYGVKCHKFGNFILKDKKQRIGRNPKTGKPAMISKRKVVLFHASPSLKKHF